VVARAHIPTFPRDEKTLRGKSENQQIPRMRELYGFMFETVTREFWLLWYRVSKQNLPLVSMDIVG